MKTKLDKIAEAMGARSVYHLLYWTMIAGVIGLCLLLMVLPFLLFSGYFIIMGASLGTIFIPIGLYQLRDEVINNNNWFLKTDKRMHKFFFFLASDAGYEYMVNKRLRRLK